jgi:hypothetical protein
MTTRDQAAANALGSVRAEGLEPAPEVVELLERWSRGELSDDELSEARKSLAVNSTAHLSKKRAI